MNRLSFVLTSIASALGLAGCAADVASYAGPPLAFTCPVKGLETIIQRPDGTTYRTAWLGADLADPDLCLSENGAGTKSRARLFGRWDFAQEAKGGTSEERAQQKNAMRALMHGRINSAGFILRGRTGEQTAEHWRILESEDIDIGGVTVKAVKLRIGFIYAGNGRPSSANLWFAPKYNLFVQSRAYNRSQQQSWKVISIKD